jgi:hypothetical protein
MEKKSLIAVGFIAMALAIFIYTTSFSQSQPKRYTVKLYSGGTLVQTWDGFDFGTMNENTLVFSVGDRHYPTRVRINGTFSVEEFN